MYPDVISFDKLNLSQFDWLEIEELEMQLIDFQCSSIWIQKFIETRKQLELIEAERLTSNISKNPSNEILETWNSIPDAFNCLKKLDALAAWGTLGSRRAANPLVRLVEGEERWEAPDPGFSLSKLGWKRAKSFCHLYGAQSYG
ncbi:dimer_Tnp_hAT domain-containing protein [Trichonephila clavipes]|uniref:Dimer_Tnp_hAT domain-containing protein n=1 Tax=Trichonephila clavipes TaxID=2585209 RepID=A0A8X6SRQ8_TRICX|nr:dimer_Tnp_hAT domain-containing protein [Trichonephila clavipes]